MKRKKNISNFRSKDVFDNRSTIEYDEYQLLPVNTKQWLNATDYLETNAEYDYRTFQANKVIDPNDNISVFDFSPLGLLKATAVIGKGTEGDYKAATGTFYERFAPSVRMEYDFFAFMNEGNPVWVKTIQREQHYQEEENSPTIEKVEYSDGFGRLLQTRSQAEDVIFGNQTFGSSGLSANQDAQNSPAVGVERDPQDPLNVVVSGWQIYNNKGEVVEQYEPFFDKGFDYTLPQLSTTGGTIAPQLGIKIKMYYDPLGRVIKTVDPDKSEQRVIFGIPNALNTPNEFSPTPWEQYTYDANDLAPLTNPNNNNVPASHYYTPKSALMDVLGRTTETKEHKAHYNADTEEYEDVVMRYLYDIRGNLLEVRDPYNRKVFEHVYDLRPPQQDENGDQQPLPPLWTKHIDSGENVVLFDAQNKLVESKNERGARTLSVFDEMSRLLFSWAKDNNLESFTVRHAIVYGDDPVHGPLDPVQTNHLGQPYKNYDESGLDTILEYDFKGNVIAAQKQVIKDSLLLNAINEGASNNWEVTPYVVDWTIAPWDEETNLLEGDYQTNVVFDALNRPTETTYPADINNERKVATTTYNRAGALEKINFDGTDYINYIAYNAKGDVILTAYGNGIMTRQLYDNKTFLLKRTRTSSYIQTGWTFADNAGVKEDKVFGFDLAGNIIRTHDQCTDCGLSATPNELTRNFTHDPLYRLLTATGRESNTQSSSLIWNDPPVTQVPNAQNSRAYTQAFEYDKLGNILKKIHTAAENHYTRRYNYQNGTNKLTDIDNNQSVPTVIANFTYDITGNQTTCQTERHYEWDYGNRMKAFYNQTSVGIEPSVYAVYLYDGGGNRTKKLVRKQGGNWESVTYIGGTFEYHKKGTEEKNYTQIANVEIRTGSFSEDITDSVLYQMKDHLGSVGLRINHSGSTVDREEYYPFGDSSLRTFTKKKYRYCGKEKDEESGLYYYGARYYMSWACRFISIDPLAEDYMHLTPYNYAGNKPITYYDIDGMQGSGEPQTDKYAPQPAPAVSTYVAPLPKIDLVPKVPKLEVPTISPSTMDAALMADHIYKYSNLTPNSTSVIGKDKNSQNMATVGTTGYILQEVTVGKDGFTAGLYKKTLEDGTEIFALVFAGTDQGKDWITNFKQGVGKFSSQYNTAYQMAQMYKNYSNITFVGHSLGGGLASLAALTTNKPAITFNAAGLSKGTKNRYGVSNTSTSKIEAYVIKGEILNYLLKPLGQGAIGNKHSLTSTMPWYSYTEFMDKYTENSNLPHEYWSALYEDHVQSFRMKNHGMDMVIKALKNKK